jgi:hypothetical protein
MLTATNLPTPEGWTVGLTVPAPGFEPRACQTRVQLSMTARNLNHSATLTEHYIYYGMCLKELCSRFVRA